MSKAELELTGAQVLIGGIGSGKTTQLLLAEKRLQGLEDAFAVYVESLVQQEDDPVHSGLLVLSFFRTMQEWALRRELDLEPSPAREKFLSADFNGFYDKLRGASRQERQDLNRESVKVLRGILKTKVLVVLFDSLDRLTDMEQMNEIIEEEVRIFVEAGVSVVMVAPQSMMYGPQRSMLNRFDEIYHQPFVDLANGKEGHDFLFEVLRRRAPQEILPDSSCQALVAHSGGVLRDLIALARSAGEHAYLTGKGPIEATHVEAAVDGFGRKKLLHLSREQLATLHRVRQKGSFVQTSDQDLTLLLTGCVLEHQKPNGAPRYEVHPTIRPLLEQIAEDP